ncbi:MAG: PDZ domain-containing protein [Woeseiaceae bacterium]|nr:PDZ domain-containing protein [Woeseiaceae bacterium]NIP21921.1 PDZ domain-containing protein [Woeseiaceae bacterium]NIS91006.1 PDZ domain-containing protein [Woeseiaceae bacterium]
MNKTALTMGISLLAGFAAAAIVFNATRNVAEQPALMSTDPGIYFDQSAATEDRIRALEEAVAQERNARMLLEEELQALYAEIEELAGGGGLVAGPQAIEGRVASEQFQEFRRRRSAATGEDRAERLVEAGFTPDRAEWILTRESELQMEQMQAVFEARQTGERPDPSALDPDRSLRQEIGDVEYEQYLEASGRPTSVAVGAVLESSPGQRAGLEPGDEIVAYGGERVFSYSDLAEATMGRESGQSVVVDIVRDGVPMQIVVDSGPIGISNRGFALGVRR